MTLDSLMQKYGSDKASTHHGYTRWYEKFIPVDRPIRMLLLGWGGPPDSGTGGSDARAFRDWLAPGSTVVSIDIVNKAIGPEHEGIIFRQGDQADADFLNALSDEHGPWDAVIDDASHLSSLTIGSFEILWPRLKSGGIYAVEDTHMAYHDFYYGEDQANPDPDQLTSSGAPTAMQYLRRLADDANHGLYPDQHWRGYDVDWCWFTYNLALAKKR